MGQDASSPSTKPPALAKPTIPGARLALTLLVLINLFNYIDRQVLAAVEPEIRQELLSDLPDQDAKFRMGLLATAFLVSYMLLSPVFGILADRFARWALVGFGVLLWSIASGASGLPWTTLGLSAGLGFGLAIVAVVEQADDRRDAERAGHQHDFVMRVGRQLAELGHDRGGVAELRLGQANIAHECVQVLDQ